MSTFFLFSPTVFRLSNFPFTFEVNKIDAIMVGRKVIRLIHGWPCETGIFHFMEEACAIGIEKVGFGHFLRAGGFLFSSLTL